MMDDLTKCLYEFVCTKRMGSLYEDKEYQETLQSVEQQTKRVKAYLDEKQQWELRMLIDHIVSQGSIEGEHLFQAGLALSRELCGLARTSRFTS